ncbi:MAG: hypothetical protein QM775_30880 [Pirellulales bacterium]
MESLVTKLSADETVETPLTEQQTAKLKKLVEENGFSEAFQNRLAGFLMNINAVNVKNLLNKWADATKFGITKDDVTAWSKLRNAAAHGRRFTGGSVEERQEQFHKSDRIESLINRLVLSMMKYEGRFHDTADWKFKPFPS